MENNESQKAQEYLQKAYTPISRSMAQKDLIYLTFIIISDILTIARKNMKKHFLTLKKVIRLN